MPRLRALLLGSLALSPLLAQGTLPDLHWRLVGPFRGGRTRAVAGVPGHPARFYMAPVNGGVWTSDDAGRSWTPIFDGQPTQSIGALAVAPSDPKILYAASGEGLQRPDLSVGDGIYRSADGGRTWTHLGLRDGQQIPALAVDPRNPDRLFAAVLGHPYGPNPERGVFRSEDGGRTWTKVLDRGDGIGASQVVLDPSHPDTVYAALWQSRLGPWEDGNQYQGTGGGLFKSTDGGATWTPLKEGLPADLVQIQVALAPSDPSRLYATLSTTKEGGYASGVGMGVYRSDDGGARWRRITEDPRPAMKIGGGDLPVIQVDPKDPDTLYSASIVTMKSTDGGRTWSWLRGAPGGDDYQNLWIDPEDPATILLAGDQGAVVTVNGGRTWSSWYNQPTAQLYHVATTAEFPYRIAAAQQESGSVVISSRGNDGAITFRDWHPAGAIEYGTLAPDPLHPDLIYGAGRTEVSKLDVRTGQVQNVTPLPVADGQHRADRTEPLAFSPVDPHRLYYAANQVFETRDGGATWRAISPDLSREHSGRPATLPDLSDAEAAKRRGAVYALAPSFQSVATLWAGTDDGLVWITRDGGAHWKDITPPALAPWSKVAQIAASRFDGQTAYVAVNRFRVDDLRPYLFRTRDGGATWQAIMTGLPADAPVNSVKEDPVRKGLLYAATEKGVWMSLDDGGHWRSLQLNLPATSARDLCVQGDDLIVATHGRSLWVLDGLAPLRQLDRVPTDAPFLFTPGPAVRVRRDTNTDTPLPADEPMGQNPPDGAVLDYALPAGVRGPVTLEILDRAGRTIRRVSSDDPIAPTPEETAAQLIPSYWIRPFQGLSAASGLHRWVWDLREDRPTALRSEYPIAAVPHETPREPQGPLVVPGAYTVRLTVGGQRFQAPLTVRMDPRVKAPATDLAALHTLQTRLAERLSEVSSAVLEAHGLRTQLAARQAQAAPEMKAALAAFDGDLAKALDGQPKAPGLEGLAESLAGLYGQTGQADARPTAAQAKAADALDAQAAPGLAAWDRLKGERLADLNARLTAAGLASLRLDQAPATLPGGGDEE